MNQLIDLKSILLTNQITNQITYGRADEETARQTDGEKDQRPARQKDNRILSSYGTTRTVIVAAAR